MWWWKLQLVPVEEVRSSWTALARQGVAPLIEVNSCRDLRDNTPCVLGELFLGSNVNTD